MFVVQKTEGSYSQCGRLRFTRELLKRWVYRSGCSLLLVGLNSFALLRDDSQETLQSCGLNFARAVKSSCVELTPSKACLELVPRDEDGPC